MYVTGATGSPANDNYGTVSYNAVTGTQLWAKAHNGPGNGKDIAYSVAVSPSGDRIFVTGGSTGTTSGMDYATIAYSGWPQPGEI